MADMKNETTWTNWNKYLLRNLHKYWGHRIVGGKREQKTTRRTKRINNIYYNSRSVLNSPHYFWILIFEFIAWKIFIFTFFIWKNRKYGNRIDATQLKSNEFIQPKSISKSNFEFNSIRFDWIDFFFRKRLFKLQAQQLSAIK